MRHIALFIPSLVGGGAERVFLNLAAGFAANGIQVDLVTARAAGNLLDQVDGRVNLIDLEKKHVLAALPAFIRYLRSSQPEVLISGLRHANVAAIFARLLSKSRAKLIITEHNTLDMQDYPWKEKLVLRLAKYIYAKADAVVAVSAGVAEEFRHFLWRCEHKIQVIYNPIKVNEICRLVKEQPDHDWLQRKETPILLSVGRLHPNKDYPTLIQSLSQISGKTDARLVILGEGVKRADIERHVKQSGLESRVSMPGFVKNPYACMRAADCFVLSSRKEGLSMVVMEALACGTSVVSTDCPSGPAELLENGKYGRLVPVGDAKALADAIMETLQDPFPDDMLRVRALDFDLPKIIRQYLLLVDRLMREP